MTEKQYKVNVSPAVAKARSVLGHAVRRGEDTTGARRALLLARAEQHKAEAARLLQEAATLTSYDPSITPVDPVTLAADTTSMTAKTTTF